MAEAASARIFTLSEAEALLPQVSFYFGRITLAQAEATQSVEALGGVEVAERVLRDGPAPPGRGSSAERLKVATGEILRSIEAINALGCLVKSLETGLVDFPAEREGRIVLLCWQYGEPRIAWWHEVDSGFSGRRPLDVGGASLMH